MADVALDFDTSVIQLVDEANRDIQGRTVSKTLTFGMCQDTVLAGKIADRESKKAGYPLAKVSIPMDRTAFRYQVGDLFKFSYAPYGVVSMICRVVGIEEEAIDSEDIIIKAVEDINYISETLSSDITFDTTLSQAITYTVVALDTVDVVESPYVISGAATEIIPLAAKKTGTETGFLLYASLDGSSYSRIDTVSTFTPHGTLDSDYTGDTFKIDNETGFSITFGENDDVSAIETITTADLLSGYNTALLGDEIISIKTVTPVSGTTYAFSGIYRGRFDSEQTSHSAGEHFWFIGKSNFNAVSNEMFVTGPTRSFKYVPFNNKHIGDVSEATVSSLTIAGRSKKPYKPENLRANTVSINPTYSEDVDLTWVSRIRGQGAGFGDPDYVTDSSPTWEGYFEVKVYVDESLVRTATAINDDEWTYTATMNIADNGGLADSVTLRLTNYITGDDSIKYESGYSEITVTKE